MFIAVFETDDSTMADVGKPLVLVVLTKLKIGLDGKLIILESDVALLNVGTEVGEANDAAANVAAADEKPYPGGTPSDGPKGNVSFAT